MSLKDLACVAAVLMCLVGLSTPAEAQESAFLAAVQDLVANPGPAAASMKAALAEWDRQTATLVEPERLAGPEGFERRLALGLAYRRRGRLDEALRQFDAAAALRPGTSDVHLLRGLTLETAGRGQEAARALKTAWESDLDNPVKAHLVLRRANLDPADRARAMDVLRSAFSRVVSGDHRASATFLFPMLELIPDTLARMPIVGSGAMAGVFAHLAAGRLDQAVAAIDAATPVPGAAEGALDRARAAEADGRLADAAREYASALAGTLAGRHALHVGIGRLAQVQGEHDAAIDAFTQAARLSPNDPIIRRELAGAYAAAGRADDAFVELVAALLLAPENAEALAAVGQIFLDTERPAEAIPVLQRVLAVRPSRYETHYALAVALTRAGRTEDAAREFARFDRLSREALDARRRSVAGEAGPASAPEPLRRGEPR
jgi:tetratricopeptide (TPR) repeat protein